MISFDYDFAKVTRYGYRKMRVTNRFIDISYQHGDSVDKFKHALAEKTTGGPDNHEVYVLEKANGTKMCFQFSDWHCYIGTDIVERG